MRADLPRRVALLAALVAAAPAAAFVRSTTAGRDPTAGACLWWGARTVPVAVNASGFAGNACAEGAAARARARLAAWSSQAPCTDFRFADGGATALQAVGNDGVQLVVVRRGACDDAAVVPTTDPCHATPGACAARFDCWEHTDAGSARVIALTTTTFNASTGEILDADMELFGWDGVSAAPLPAAAVPPSGWYFTCGTTGSACAAYGDASCLYMDLGGTVTHEAGHMLGLDHVCQYASLPPSTCFPAAVMAPTASLLDTSKRALTSDDVAGVCAIYPAGKPPDAASGCFGAGPPPRRCTSRRRARRWRPAVPSPSRRRARSAPSRGRSRRTRRAAPSTPPASTSRAPPARSSTSSRRRTARGGAPPRRSA